ncbi:MAG: protein phosphatase 2C domain-containing protein [Anaerolineae bacterium]
MTEEAVFTAESRIDSADEMTKSVVEELTPAVNKMDKFELLPAKFPEDMLGMSSLTATVSPANESFPDSGKDTVAEPGQIPTSLAQAAGQDQTGAEAVGKEQTGTVTPPLPGLGTSATEPAPLAVKLTPLAVGTNLLGRYTILELVASTDTGNLYRAEDEEGCASCGQWNPRGQEFCRDCGYELKIHGKALLKEEPLLEENMPPLPDGFIEGGRSYVATREEPKRPATFGRGVHLQFGALSDVGLVRGAQNAPDEDSLFAMALSSIYESITAPTMGLFMVADGVGGSERGEVASRLCVQTVSRELIQRVALPILGGQVLDDDTVRGEIQRAIKQANYQVLELGGAPDETPGTTITLALVINNRAYIANVGDSRTYRFVDDRLDRITRDHSLVEGLVASGQIKPEEVYDHPDRNVITRSLGDKPPLKVDLFPEEGGALELEPGTRLLLCCDGLWELVHPDDLRKTLSRPKEDLQSLCQELVNMANEAGGPDNISLILVDVGAS